MNNKVLNYKESYIKKSSRKVLFNTNDFSYNLFWTSGKKVELLMDDIIYKYLMQGTKETSLKLIELYDENNVKRVLDNIRIIHGTNIYQQVLKYLDIK